MSRRFPHFPSRKPEIDAKTAVWSAVAVCALLASGCTDVRYDRYRTDLKTGDEVPLYEWPDSAYVAGIEAMLAAEVLTDEARKADVAITIDPRRPVAPPPGMGHAGIQGMTAQELAEAKAPVRKPAAAPADARPAKSAAPRPRFAEEFMAALDRMAADPRKGRTAEPLAGERLEQLLVRQYGPEAKGLPLGVVEYQLKLMNPGVDLKNLRPGETVLLPRL